MRLHAETFQADIAHARPDHIGGIEGMYGNPGACDDKGQRAFHAPADDAQLHLRPFPATQPLHDVDACHLDAGYGRVVDVHDPVAGKDSHLLGRAVDDRLDHDERIVDHIELYADSLEVALQRFVHRLGFLGVGIGGMRVELLEHASDGILRQLLFVHGVHVEVRYRHLRQLELSQWRSVSNVTSNLCLTNNRQQRHH